MAEPMQDPMAEEENPPSPPPGPSSRATSATVTETPPSPTAQLLSEEITPPPSQPTACLTPSLPGPSNITLPGLQPNPLPFSFAAPSDSQSPFLAVGQRAFPRTRVRLSEAELGALIQANLGTLFDFTSLPAPNPLDRPTPHTFNFTSLPAPNPPPDTGSPPPARRARRQRDRVRQQDRELRRQERRLERREERREERQREREARREARREERRQTRQRERDAAAPELQLFQMRMGRLPDAEERETLVREHVVFNAMEGIAVVERVAAAEDPAAIASLAQTNRNREITQQQRPAVAAADPPAGFSPRLRHILFGHVPGTDMAAERRAYEAMEAMEAAMGMGPEETEEAARARVEREAQIEARARMEREAQTEAREAWMAERMREQEALADQVRRSRKMVAERRKDVAILEMECLFEKLAGERERKDRERFEKRGGGPLERLKIRVAENFRVLGGEVLHAHHAHHHTDPNAASESLLAYRATSLVASRAANEAANAMPVDAIKFTPAEKKEVERVVRAVTEAGEEVSPLSGTIGAAVVDGIVEVGGRPRMLPGPVGQRRGGWRRNILSDVMDVGGVMWDELERERVEIRAAAQRMRVELEEESAELLRRMAGLEEEGREEARTEGAEEDEPQLREVERNEMRQREALEMAEMFMRGRGGEE
ncbi:hypothetical protein V500_07103 [Pseudogymnoascus sp. VKM F-4518 (FW-2643)]|nr:hypothetical protein V500_07103 [Pseudogymnoascus sp. VKM F-4518 (FW-2643)]